MVITQTIEIETAGDGDVMDITPHLNRAVAQAGVAEGLVTVFVSGSTAAVTTVEYEPGLVADLKALFQRLAPRELAYQHDRRWGDGNGHAHVRASLLGPSLSIPLAQGGLLLGTWQQVVVIDFDVRPRRRQVVIQVLGG